MRGDRAMAAVIVALCMFGRSDAEIVPQAGVADSRIRTALYSGDQVYELYGVVGYDLDLEFEAGESFAGISVGDPDALIYSAHDHILSLRPRVVSARMNVTVSTSRRRYYFAYTIVAPQSNLDQVMYAVRFTYPPESKSKDALSPTHQVDVELERAKANRPRNYDYWYCGSSQVRPIAASDDGIHTRLTFPSHGELPAVFVRNDDDTESLLNFNVDDGDMVIHRVAARFVVRRGRLVGCIFNKGFVGGGERLNSETVAPDVRRVRKEPTP